MQCTSPVLIRVKGYVGPKLETGLFVPCGHCLACRIAHAREWSVRLLHELDYWPCACFATLTYAPEYMPSDGSIRRRELQLFFKRLRKSLGDRKLRYYACGEYGEESGRPHYHAIVFGLGQADQSLVEDAWPYGFVKLGTVTYDSCRYVAQYVDKKFNGAVAKEVYGDREIPFQLASQGLGRQFALDNRERLERDLGCTVDGNPVGLPRYYRKVLDLDTSQLAAKAQEAQEEIRSVFAQRGVAEDGNDYVFARAAGRAQADIDLRSRLSLKSKGPV